MRASLLFLPFLAACTSIAVSPGQPYRPAGGSTVMVGGTLHQTEGMFAPTNAVDITIDGEKVAGGQFSGGVATFTGRYQGRPVRVDCSAAAAGSVAHQLTFGTDRIDVYCSVFVADEFAARVTLVP